jgi:hypothetical protein
VSDVTLAGKTCPANPFGLSATPLADDQYQHWQSPAAGYRSDSTGTGSVIFPFVYRNSSANVREIGFSEGLVKWVTDARAQIRPLASSFRVDCLFAPFEEID